MFDDDDDKTRRNLVVFSALVILLNWLELNGSVLLILFKDAGANVSERKVASALLVINLYLLYRYRFSDAFKNAMEIKFEDIKNIKIDQIAKLTKSFINGYVITAHDPQIFSPSIKDFMIREISESRTVNIETAKIESLQVFDTIFDGDWSGNIGVGYSLKDKEGNTCVATSAYRLRFNLISPHKFFIKIRVMTLLFVYSRTGINLLVPFIFSIVSLFILTMQTFT